MNEKKRFKLSEATLEDYFYLQECGFNYKCDNEYIDDGERKYAKRVIFITVEEQEQELFIRLKFLERIELCAD